LGNFLFIRNLKVMRQSPIFGFLTALTLAIVGYVIFSYVGALRVSGISQIGSLSVGGFFDSERIRIQTFGSSVYSALVAVFHAETVGLYWGESYIGQVINSVPSFIPTP